MNDNVCLSKNMIFDLLALDNKQKSCMLLALGKMDNNNLVSIGAEFKKELQVRAGLSRATVYRALEDLKEKKYISLLSNELKAKFDVFGDQIYILFEK